MTTAEIEGTQPAVYGALAKILAELGVAKGGTLPANMGGKPYITAVDVAREIKNLFVKEHLIFLPNEEIFKHESVILKDRINVLISITGRYEIISTEDGSSVTVSGTGDGLAGGTAVASNIASTNALKNALLRTFLITEQSAEDAAKNGPGEESVPATTTAAQRKVEAAKQATTAPSQAVSDLQKLNEKIRVWINDDDDRRTAVNQFLSEAKNNGVAATQARQQAIEHFGVN